MMVAKHGARSSDKCDVNSTSDNETNLGGEGNEPLSGCSRLSMTAPDSETADIQSTANVWLRSQWSYYMFFYTCSQMLLELHDTLKRFSWFL